MLVSLTKANKSFVYVFLTILAFVLYGNSINNEYALDDNIVVDGNKIVEKGLSGIREVFTSRYAKDNKQEYEYRPMVSLSFAVEKQFFGKLTPSQTIKEKKRKDKLTQANVSHFFNVVIYTLTCILMFNLLQLILKEHNQILPLLITILFMVHPLHTEAVSNIKSRDELFVLLGIILSLIGYVKYATLNQYKHLLIAIFWVLFSLYSKPNALMILGVAPVILYFIKADYKKIGIVLLSIVLIIIASILIRKGLLTGKPVRNLMFFENPLFVQGTFMDRITLGLYCSWFYLEMLIFPYYLSFYYGFNQIPMADFSYWQVWAALLFFVPLGIYGFIRFLKRDLLGLGIVLWLGIMLGVINVAFPIVGIVADRFTYAFSFGFCIVATVLLVRYFKIDITSKNSKIAIPSGFLAIFMLIVTVYSARTITRNPNWHDYMTIFTSDISHLTESAKAHALLANTLYPMVVKEIQKNPKSPEINKDVNTLIYHFKEAVRIDSTYATSWNNLGSVYVNYVRDYNQSIYYCKKAIAHNPNYLEANFNVAYSYMQMQNVDSAYHYSLKVVEIDPTYLKIFDMMNNFIVAHQLKDRAIIDLIKLSEKSEKPKNIYVAIANLYSLNSNDNYSKSIEYFEKAFNADPTDSILCNHLANLYKIIGNNQKSAEILSLCNIEKK